MFSKIMLALAVFFFILGFGLCEHRKGVMEGAFGASASFLVLAVWFW